MPPGRTRTTSIRAGGREARCARSSTPPARWSALLWRRETAGAAARQPRAPRRPRLPGLLGPPSARIADPSIRAHWARATRRRRAALFALAAAVRAARRPAHRAAQSPRRRSPPRRRPRRRPRPPARRPAGRGARPRDAPSSPAASPTRRPPTPSRPPRAPRVRGRDPRRDPRRRARPRSAAPLDTSQRRSGAPGRRPRSAATRARATCAGAGQVRANPLDRGAAPMSASPPAWRGCRPRACAWQRSWPSSRRPRRARGRVREAAAGLEGHRPTRRSRCACAPRREASKRSPAGRPLDGRFDSDDAARARTSSPASRSCRRAQIDFRGGRRGRRLSGPRRGSFPVRAGFPRHPAWPTAARTECPNGASPMAAKDTDDRRPTGRSGADPMLDMSQAAVKKMIADARSAATSPMTSSTRSCRPTRCPPSRSRT